MSTDLVEGIHYNRSQTTWRGKHKDKRWKDMSGGSELEKKLNFALYRRGLFATSDEEDDPYTWRNQIRAKHDTWRKPETETEEDE